MFLGPRCPSCKKKIKDFLFDYETGMGKCTTCHANYNLERNFSINDAKFFAKILNGKKKEKLMELFNLEEVPKIVNVRPLVYILFWVIFLIFLAVMALTLNETIGKKVSSILGIVIFALFLTHVYKAETRGTIIRNKKHQKAPCQKIVSELTNPLSINNEQNKTLNKSMNKTRRCC